MKIAFLSKADAAGGGASRIAQDLAEGFREQGHETVHWVSWTHTGYDAHRRRLYGERWQRSFYRYSRNIKSWFAPDVIPFEWPNLYWQNLPANFDLVHVHDISSAMSSWSVQRLAKQMPVLWTQHDCSAFTGGCINPLSCTNYRSGCGNCPQHGQWPLDSRFDYSRLKRRLNQQALDVSQLTLATPSRWLQQWALDSGHVQSPPLLLRNGVNINIFKPVTRPVKDVPIIVLAAASLSSPYKGITDAINALTQLLTCRAYKLIVIGDADDSTKNSFQGLPIVTFTGHIRDQNMLASYYHQADLLLMPSLADNQPLQLLEAMACGLPTVAYATGGIPELLGNNERGWLVPTGDFHALANALAHALSSVPDLIAKGMTAREWVTDNHSKNVMFAEHLTAYQNIITTWQERYSKK
ncbi:glycosyltransferase [Aeromonas caviae]|uniref:Glycosyltransferase n=1 Tax=Aeromonas caviae TaxID=648 RepID=A0AAF0GCP7_AERCA|nr:glycosyltransferase [Aeromonas caviae]WGC86136.1 glycosyltransferase [Aeromonas caviae]BBG88924.1 hypothetical protein ACGSH8M1_015900 [Aeromonas caviae]BBT52598.1 hypothetical protein WP8S18C01_15610 [Aeromonas caviae]